MVSLTEVDSMLKNILILSVDKLVSTYTILLLFPLMF